jgi:cytochrome c553
MRRLTLGIVLSVALFGCGEKEPPAVNGKAEKQIAADVAAGKAFAERECKSCHGLDGRSVAPAIPHLAAQRERYLTESIKAYREGKRPHAALKEMAGRMSEADVRNVAAYYAGLAPVASAPAKDAPPASPYESGKTLAAACAKCHNEDGNSTTPGVPSLAGQQPRYLVVAIQEYLHKERKAAPMHALLPGLKKLELENLALYFASQTPAQRAAPATGDPAAGEPLSGVCGGCHGSRGLSTDLSTPSLAGQDATYLVDAIKAYRTTRKRESMRTYVTGISDKDIADIAAFYSVQKSRAAEKGQTIVQDLTEKCERCHGAAAGSTTMVVPRIRGQDRDYLVKALRAYRDDRRESTMMHKMSLPYGDSIIESISSYYSAQPAK